MVLAGDIGGTNTRLAFFDGEPGHLKARETEVFPSGQHSGPEEIAHKFLSKHSHPIDAICFGIAGPVRDGVSRTPNLPWVVDSRNISKELGVPIVELINDLEANAHGIAELGPHDFVALNQGEPGCSGNQALISAGTGLGEAGLLAEAGGCRPFASEGGHADFAPRNDVEIELLRFLMVKFGRVSWERVLSGPGLVNIYEFLRDTKRGIESKELADEIASGNAAAAISRHGLEGAPEICVQALDIFVSIYGAEAGNLALKVMATGGMFVGGGIAPKIIKKLQGPAFLEAFYSKGRVRAVLEAIPVRVITNDKTALLGAGRVATLAARRGSRVTSA
jgi:glucokinase